MFRKMVFNLFIFTTITYVIIINVFLCHCKVMIWIQHSDVENYFQFVRSENVTEDETPSMEEGPILSTTTNLLIDPPYRKSKLLYRILYPENYGIFKRQAYIRNLRSHDTDYDRILLTVESSLVPVDALPCIVYKKHTWYVINGYENDLYFTAESVPQRSNVILTGLLEPMPIIVSYYNVRKLEQEYLVGLQWSTQTKKRTSICKLDSFHKFRLCSTVYAAWRNRHPIIAKHWFTMKNFDGNECTEDNYISSLYGSSDQLLNEFPVELLFCSVNSDAFVPNFYVTPDEANSHSVFIIVRSMENNMKFYLKRHVKNIKLLNSVTRVNLLVDTFMDSEDDD